MKKIIFLSIITLLVNEEYLFSQATTQTPSLEETLKWIKNKVEKYPSNNIDKVTFNWNENYHIIMIKYENKTAVKWNSKGNEITSYRGNNIYKWEFNLSDLICERMEYNDTTYLFTVHTKQNIASIHRLYTWETIESYKERADGSLEAISIVGDRKKEEAHFNQLNISLRYGEVNLIRNMEDAWCRAINKCPAKGAGIGSELEKIKSQMVFLSGGTFQMGDGGNLSYENFVHNVTLNDFIISKYEITKGQWNEVMRNNPNSNNEGCDECPVSDVSWNDVQDFIAKLNSITGLIYRLPTEAEWEYAARGGNKSRKYDYSGDNNVSSVAWIRSNGGMVTHPVGMKKANELGLFDMTGNVQEFCSDWYQDDYYRQSPSLNPQGPPYGTEKSVRGGDYISEWIKRIGNRKKMDPDNANAWTGFRLVLDR